MKNKRGVALAFVACAGVAATSWGQCPGAPTVEADLGTVVPGTPIFASVPLNGSAILWYKLTLSSPVSMSALTFLNIDTSTTTGVDTELGLYDCSGNLIAADDDDAEGLLTSLSFGSGNAVQVGTGGVWSNGRDGALAAGEYYLAAAVFNATFGLSGWNVTSTGTAVATANLNILQDTTTAMADPAGTTDLGTMTATDTRALSGEALGASEVRWFKVTVPAANNAAASFWDIDTEGSALSPANTTRIAIYNVTGVITGTIAPATRLNATTGLTDAVDGTDSLSQISLGTGTRPQPGNGLAYNGRDGSLQAGTYLIGIAGPGTAPAGTTAAGSNFGFTSTSVNVGTFNLNMATGVQSNPPSGVGAASAVAELGTTLLTVTVTPGTAPSSTGLAVSVDMSSIGGSGSQTFYDNGTNGDAIPNNNVFSYQYTLPMSVLGGAQSLPFTITDAQSRSGSGNINFTVANGPSGACCTGSNCSLSRETLCAPSGGAWQGPGTDCGSGTYSPFAVVSGTPFEDISTTGTLLTTATNCDDCGQSVTLPFSFNFLGNGYNAVWVCSNGFLQFGGTSTTFTNVAIPNATAPNNIICPLWDDFDLLDTRNGPGAGALYYLDDSATNNRVVFSWQGVGQYNVATPVVDSNDFQAILHANGNIEFRYGNVPTILSPQVAGDTVTIGFENATGTAGESVDGPSVVGEGSTALFSTYTPGPNVCGPACDTIDFNGDGLLPDVQDISDFIFVFGGGTCPTGTCGDIDFNNDGLVPDIADIESLIRVFGGGSCL